MAGRPSPPCHQGTVGYFGWCDVVACAPDDETILFYGGVALERSTDGGSTWSSLPVHADQHAAVFAPSNSNVVYFANDGGVWRSDNKGATVRKVSNGLVSPSFTTSASGGRSATSSAAARRTTPPTTPQAASPGGRCGPTTAAGS